MNIGVYKELQQRLKGFSIVDCAVRSRDCIYAVFDEDGAWDNEDSQYKVRFVFYYPKTERVWGYAAYSGVSQPVCCVLPEPDGTFIVCDEYGQFTTQRGIDSNTGFEDGGKLPLVRKSLRIDRLRAIAGQAYAAGNGRTVFRRERDGQWTCLSGNDNSLRERIKTEKRGFGFTDIAGFAADDIYACGGDGDLCHFDGKNWRELDPPTNNDFDCICCADNGLVYLGGRNGLLVEGRDDHWRMIGRGYSGPRDPQRGGLGDADVHDLIWFKERLYLAIDNGLKTYHEDRFEDALSGFLAGLNADSPPEPALTPRLQALLAAGGADEQALALASLPKHQAEGIIAPAGPKTLSTDGEILALAGADKLVVLDNGEWKTLYMGFAIDSGGHL